MLLSSVVEEARIQSIKEDSDDIGNWGEYLISPRTEEEISAILKYAHEQSLSVIPVGGGTKRGFGGTEEKADILLSLADYKGVVEYSEGDMTLTVRAGTTMQELSEYLGKHQQMLPLDPMWPSHATIGGVIAANDSGAKRLRYGSARDLVIGTRLVYPDGKVLRTGGKVVKNVAGYDMNKLFIGSMGTLAVLTEITLKLRPVPKYESLVILHLPQVQNVLPFAISLLDSMIEPVSLEVLSPSTNFLLNGKEQYALAIAFEDVEKAVHYQEDWVHTHKPENAVIDHIDQEDARNWWRRFSELAPAVIPGTDIDSRIALKIGSKNLDALDLLVSCHELGEKLGVQVEAHGGLGHGIAKAYVGGGDLAKYAGFIDQLRASEKAAYVIIQHAPLAVRRELDVWGKRPPYFALLEGIKKAIDPKRILNPSRFVGGI
ncbi:FAD-binding oxidoreductase [Ammoniphilus resinae]|uniref:Glycolate oxidase FAD binding subunit n=1 Tax=Ammoniphilus resinae TaxID=861532 RepID=A0ABS4GW66_9BACL|nr:FAD-binding oxidoreductase [Ammoniphilus resinae]MBP1934105.1 glycolate oxidase FAD binding subunit [Ammoniphilus resinae]